MTDVLPPPPSPSGAQKPWLSREVSVQWVLGLVIAAVLWAHNERVRSATEIAQLQQAVAQRADLVERRNREQDQLRECLQRQIDIAHGCAR